MQKGQPIRKNISTTNGEDEFQLLFHGEEDVGILTSRSGLSFFILDSQDYWYDVIQSRYPLVTKCTCGNSWFKIMFDYYFRAGSEEVNEIQINSVCVSCGKPGKSKTILIDYSPTKTLLENPITFCPAPKLKYKLYSYTSYWEKTDLENYFRFISEDLKLAIYCLFWEQKGEKRLLTAASIEESLLLADEQRFIYFYFMRNGDKFDPASMTEDEKGIYIRNDIWRKHEIIQLSSISMTGYGELYYNEFCMQYIENGLIKDKSIVFERSTILLTDWLKSNFTSERGKDCFDGKEAWRRIEPKINKF